VARGEVTGRKLVQTADRPKRRRGPPSADPTAIEPMLKDEPDGRVSADATPIRGPPSADASSEKKKKPGEWRKQPQHPAAYSIVEFCAAHRLSPAMYFKLKAAGLGPRTMEVVARTLISVEAAADWRREREAAAVKQGV